MISNSKPIPADGYGIEREGVVNRDIVKQSWWDVCDKPNWVVLYLVFVSFLFGSIAGIGLAYLMTK